MIDENAVESIALVYRFFNSDPRKTSDWFTTKNLNFGGSSPLSMILMGRTKRLREFIENALNQNAPNL